MERIGKASDALPKFDPIMGIKAVAEVTKEIYSTPASAIALQSKYAEKSLKLISYAMEKLSGGSPAPVYEADKKDRRFSYEEWQNNLFFDLLKQLYLLNSEWLNEMLDAAPNIDSKTKKIAQFFIKQLINASAPTNFLCTNPEAIAQAIATNGASLSNGLGSLLHDLDASSDVFDISRVDKEAFTLGENIACTAGQVIYKNQMMELIAYTPTTPKIYEIPLLIVPPWINKYYILDLSPQNSLVKWLVEQGFSVFLISWVNPPAAHSDITFESYLKDGALSAINFILKTFNQPKLNILGYCVGGTLTSIALAYLAKRKEQSIINSASFLTTLTDFSEVGDVSVFINEEEIAAMEQVMNQKGYYSGDIMNLTFSVLRSNDMIWYFVINNYLLGKKPSAFDILYWNSDATRLSAKMHSFYLRNMYLENNLVKPNKIVIDNVPIDLREITTPCHFIATQFDHIAPWISVYKAMNTLNCEREFTLAGSGHVAGIVNPPINNKYRHWVSTSKEFPMDPKAWLENAKEVAGSWWNHWSTWLAKQSGNKVAFTEKNDVVSRLAIGKAPGSYVREK